MNIKIIFINLFCFGYIVSCSGQDLKDKPILRNLSKIDLGSQGIGFTSEQRLNDKTTIDLSSGIGGAYNIGEGHFEYVLNVFHPAFYFSVTPKFYYNQKKRMKSGKKSVNNSGNYIGVRLKYTTSGISSKDRTRNALLINLHWGIQRTIANYWTINAHIGGGYAQDLNNQFGTVYPSAEIKFSYILSR